MLYLVDKGDINRPTTKVVLEEVFHNDKGASEFIMKKKLSQISNADKIREMVN